MKWENKKAFIVPPQASNDGAPIGWISEYDGGAAGVVSNGDDSIIFIFKVAGDIKCLRNHFCEESSGEVGWESKVVRTLYKNFNSSPALKTSIAEKDEILLKTILSSLSE